MSGIAGAYSDSALLLPTCNDLIKVAANKQNVLANNNSPLEFDCVILSSVMLLAVSIEIKFKAII